MRCNVMLGALDGDRKYCISVTHIGVGGREGGSCRVK